MSFRPSPDLPDVIIIEPTIYRDARGHFVETYQADNYRRAGIPGPFVQDNMSRSRRDVLRGLHYQLGRPQGKLIWAVDGVVLDVAVDIRRGSPTFGRWTSVELSAENCRQLYVPVCFAHGFCVVSDTASVAYKCTDFYAPQEERGIRWDDPALAIEWPTTEPVVSAKDAGFPFLADVQAGDLPVFGDCR